MKFALPGRQLKMTDGRCRMCTRWVLADMARGTRRRRFCSLACEHDWEARQLGADPYT